MITKVLVSLDESEVSAGILPHVAYLARELGVPVVLLSVIDPDASAGERQEAGQRLERFTHGLREQGLQAQSLVSTGSEPAGEILSQALQQQCDLIAIATHDRNLLGQAVRGSVTNEVVRSAQVPVLAITPEKQESQDSVTPAARILVPLDGSSFAEAVLPYIEFLARKLALRVLLVQVIHYEDIYPPLVSSDMATVPTTVDVLGEAEEAKEEEVVRYLKGLAGSLEAKGIDVGWQVLRGPVSSSISALAQELQHSLIALASHGRSGLARWVMGSVAEELLRDTGDPVLVIPSTVAEDAAGGEE